MAVFEAIPKQWGNSLGITLPKEIINNEFIKKNEPVKVLIVKEQKQNLRDIFGTIKLKKSAKELMDEIDEGYD